MVLDKTKSNMDSVVMENSQIDVDENQGVKSPQSAENFQKFMYDLFEKNGVMNDLRSYLRGHIVNVLRSAQTGDHPSCQKHFTQRLELTFQALNILIAEYLLRLEFSYTLSVFVSEIPLANMVFSFAKTLMKKADNDDSRLRFKDSDVWCILNYLGVKCDSEHASSIVEMYRLEQNSPLLLCILKSAPLFKKPIVIQELNSSHESLSSSNKSSESVEERDTKEKSPQRKHSFQEKCRHYVFCKTCQSKMTRITEKYKKKKKDIVKNLKESSINSQNVESLMKNISLMERSLIDEMFDQLKSVYEAEMELLKEEEDKRVKRSLATHSTQLQKRRDEMEESFKAREAEFENNVQQKKRFLWGLARALREQHQHMTRAMHDVRAETDRLSSKEDSLKSQLAEAEQILRQRGEDMRHQISEELAILEGHLESMKRERDSINRERMQLEQYKDRTVKHIENEDLKPHYDLVKKEFSILRKYLETEKLQPKCVIERSTLTELHDVTSRIDVVLNNAQERDDVSRDEGRAKPKQVVNDLKKPKNVNFSQSNLDEIYRERSRSRSRSSASSEAGDAQFDADQNSIQRLRDENEQLRCFARQQREHIDRLSGQRAELPPAPAPAPAPAPPAPAPAPPPACRPRTAPSPALYALHAHNQRLSASASVNRFSFGWRKGAGEELSFLSNAQPRIMVPGDAIPFVGVVTRHNDNRRYLINQWRTLRRRMSPLGGGISKPRTSSPMQRNLRERPETAGPSVRIHLDQVENETNMSQANTEPRYQQEYYRQPPATPERPREKSPKSALREVKENLRNDVTTTSRDKSPGCVLREAKLRLRKLEIEAEAVEKSYMDFRRKQDVFRGERGSASRVDLETKASTSTYRLNETYTGGSTSRGRAPTSTNDYDRYFKEYQTKLSIAEHFKNKNTAAVRINPIPNEYSTQPKKTDYLETPLTEFRKYYHTNERIHSPRPKTPQTVQEPETTNITKGTRKEILRLAKNDKIKELELLKHNIGKIYNMPERAIVETPPTNESNNEVNEWKESNNDSINEQNSIDNESNVDRNLLRVEVESVTEVNDLKATESQSMLLIVESSVDNINDVEISDIEMEKDKISTEMTIIISPKSSPKHVLSDNSNVRDEPMSDRSETNKTPRNGSVSGSFKTSRKGSIKSSVKSTIKSAGNVEKSPRTLPNSGNSRNGTDNMTTDDVVSMYHSDDALSSDQTKQNKSKRALDNTSELEQNEDPDYPDDFSADVDNYNSRSEYENNSPISQPKTSEDENFWDS